MTSAPPPSLHPRDRRPRQRSGRSNADTQVDGRPQSDQRTERGHLPRKPLLVDLAVFGLGDEGGGWGEVVAVAVGQFTGAGYEAGQAALVAVDVLDHAAGPRGEADAEDGADVGVGD